MKEIFKPIKGYPNYQISNYGRVKSLARTWYTGNRGQIVMTKGETILKLHKNGIRNGVGRYYSIKLLKKGVENRRTVHTLVWDAFGNRERNGQILQLDHIDNNTFNNRIDNLRLVTNRENAAKGKLLRKKTSKYTGVCWNKNASKWAAQITIKGVPNYLGYYSDEYQAHLAYQKILKELKLGSPN